ncbi:MAG: pitrilysin family protein [Deltaproteobacteria bacterium]
MNLVALATALALAAPPAPRTIDTPRIPFQRFVLSNGLVLIVHEDHKAPIAAVNVWYHVGSKNERPGKTGFAHLFEHLMFNGSEHFNDDWFKVLERIGGTDLNGTTNRDRTNYFQNVPTPALDTVLWMESDRMGHLLGAIDQARLDEQRGVVKNEKRQGENQPYGRAWEALSAGSYPAGHPYSWTTIGSMTDLDAATLQDVKDWFKDWYGAANAVIVVAGDVKADEVKAKVEKYFGNIPSGPPLTRQEAWVAKRTGEHRQAMADRVPQPRVYLSWNTPQAGSSETEDLELAARILSSGKSSRLYKRLVYDGQIATDTSASQMPSEIGGQFMITATARPGGELAPVEKAAREELARFLDKGPTAQEVERARTEMLAQFTRGAERIGGFGGKSDVLAQGEVFGGRPDFYEQRLARIRSATPARLQETARRWLSDGVFVLEVTPYKEGKVSGTDADRAKMPEAGKPPAPRFPDVDKAVLGNGLRVVVVNRPTVPVVNLYLVLDAGYSSDPRGGAGTARLAATLLTDGTTTRNALQISDELRDLGATLSGGSSLDSTYLSMSALRARLDPSLQLFADVALHPSFPEAELDRQRKQLLAAIDRERTEPSSMAARVLPRLVYGDGHPYANPASGSGTKASVAAITRADVEGWYRSRFQPGDAVLVVVGDVSLKDVLPRLEKLFGGWAPGRPPAKNLALADGHAPSRVYLVDRPGSIQSVIMAGFAAPPRANPDEIAQGVVNRVLGGNFTSRINMNLREDKHWTYGARTSLADARGNRLFFVSAPVQADKTKESMQEIQKELSGIVGSRPVTADELAAAKGSLTLALPGRWETNGSVASSIVEVETLGLGAGYHDAYAGKVAELSAEQVAQAAKFIRPGEVIWVVVGDRAKIEKGIAELGMGAPVLLDADGNAAK